MDDGQRQYLASGLSQILSPSNWLASSNCYVSFVAAAVAVVAVAVA